MEVLHVPVPINFVLIGFDGEGNGGVQLLEDDMRRWFENMDFEFAHTRVQVDGYPQVSARTHLRQLSLLPCFHRPGRLSVPFFFRLRPRRAFRLGGLAVSVNAAPPVTGNCTRGLGDFEVGRLCPAGRSGFFFFNMNRRPRQKLPVPGLELKRFRESSSFPSDKATQRGTQRAYKLSNSQMNDDMRHMSW